MLSTPTHPQENQENLDTICLIDVHTGSMQSACNYQRPKLANGMVICIFMQHAYLVMGN